MYKKNNRQSTEFTMKKLNFILPFAILTVLFAPLAVADVLQPSAGQLFGISAGYNNVFFGDFYGRNGDVEGHAAIQGNVDVQSYSFGAGEQVMHQSGPVLVVGGNVTASSSDVYDGDTYIGGKLTPQNGQTMWNALGTKGTGPSGYNLHDSSYQGTAGTVYVNDDSNFNRPWNVPENHKSFEEAGISSIPFDFTVAQSELRSVSSELFAMNETVTGEANGYGAYTVDLTGKNGLQVLTVDASLFDSINTFNIIAGADTTLVINVFGDELNFNKMAMYINGNQNEFTGDFDGSNILLNTNATNVNVSSVKLNMSVLALDAHFDIQYGHISGQAFGASAHTTNGGEFHAYYTFDDKHVGGNVTPEPATLLIFGVGLAGLGFYRRRKTT